MSKDLIKVPAAQDMITIGITCFNASDTIARAVDSALKQEWDNLEILIVDDCSTDNSAALIEKKFKGNSKVRLIKHEKNLGVAAARQTIIDNAKGDFIAFFDDDDQSKPTRIKTQHQRIIDYEKNNNIKLVACYASGKRIYPNGYELKINAIGSRPVTPKGSDVADYLLFYRKKPKLFYGAGTPTCALMARKDTFDKAGGFDPSFRRVEDIDFAVRLALMGGHFIGCPEELFIQHATQGGDKSPEKNMEAEVMLAHKHKEYLRSVGRYEYATRWPLIRYHHFTGHHGRMLAQLLALFVKSPIKTASHFFYTAPRRLIHEIKMRKKN